MELLESCIARIEEVDGALNAFVTLDLEGAREAAKEAEDAVRAGELLSALHGLPLGIKDLTATAGIKTTFGSLLYENHVPDADDPIVDNLRDEGAIILGKTNTPEFGAGANTKNRVFGATGNPFDPHKTCGGSSGGSAVALATGQVPLATGSDYGGSLRTPAAFCGVVGFRPSPGVVPAVERAASLLPFSVQGPMARTVADVHLLYRAQADVDPRDPYSSRDAFDLADALMPADLSEVDVAFSSDLGACPVDDAIAAVFKARTDSFRQAFANADDAAPDFSDVHESFEILRGVNFVAAHRERLERHRDKLGPNVIDNTTRGLAYDLGDVARAHTQQTALYHRFNAFFDDFDVLICPAAAVSPFPHEQNTIETINGEAMPTYMRWLALTYAPTMALACAAVLPCGVDEAGMPFGLQVIGPKGADGTVLAVAAALEAKLARDPVTARPQADLAALQRTS